MSLKINYLNIPRFAVIIVLMVFSSLSLIWLSYKMLDKGPNNVYNYNSENINNTCINDKMNDMTLIIWFNESNCDEWKFSNKMYKIFSRNESIKLLSNTTLISIGISIDRRLGYTFNDWMFRKKTIKSIYKHRLRDGREFNGTQLQNNLVLYSTHNLILNATYTKLISNNMRNLIRNNYNKGQKIILFIPISLPTNDWFNAYNYTLNVNGIDCNQLIHIDYSYHNENVTIFKKCWKLNVQKGGLIFNKKIKHMYYNIVDAINRYYSIYNKRLLIIFRTYHPKSTEPLKKKRSFHPTISNIEGYFYVNNNLYKLLCDKLTINSNKWKLINMYEIFLNKTSFNRLKCFPKDGGGFHLQDLGRYVYAQAFVNTVANAQLTF
eukprot:450592_1